MSKVNIIAKILLVTRGFGWPHPSRTTATNGTGREQTATSEGTGKPKVAAAASDNSTAGAAVANPLHYCCLTLLLFNSFICLKGLRRHATIIY